jgi:hypothetical protein
MTILTPERTDECWHNAPLDAESQFFLYQIRPGRRPRCLALPNKKAVSIQKRLQRFRAKRVGVSSIGTGARAQQATVGL